MAADVRLEDALHPGDTVVLDGISYTITGAPIGLGGSALIYPARRPDTMMEYTIKECFPLSGNAHTMQFSRQNGVIRAVDPTDKNAALQLAHYRKALAAEAQIGQALRNQSVRILGVWVQKAPSSITTGGQTFTDVQDGIYAVLERMDKKGLSFTALLQRLRRRFDRDFPLHSLVCMIEQTLYALQRVHDNGYLFGDIQQGNIFFCDCWPENGRVGFGCLMDFGCAHKLEPDGFTTTLSKHMVFSTPGFIPPELLCRAPVLRLGKQADIYSVGCLMLNVLLPGNQKRLLGPSPRYDNRLLRSDVPARLGCTTRVQKFLDEILEKAMAENPADRYTDAAAMLQDILLLKTMTEPPRCLLPANLSDPDYFHPGSRRQELQKMKQLLQNNSTIYLWGLGGIGKTELAIQLAKLCNPVQGAYLVHFKNSMRETILSLPFSGYEFCPPNKNMTGEALVQAEYQERMQILQEHYTNALLIIDNFDVPEKTLDDLRSEPEFQQFLGLDLTRIFTTRYPFPDHRDWEVLALADSDLLPLMRHFCHDPTIPDESLLQLIRAVGGHTLTVVLMAKLLRESCGLISPASILTALRESQLSTADFPTVTSEQNRIYSQKQIFAHLKALFDCSRLSDVDRVVLCCASLLPANGMHNRLFASCLPKRQATALISLVKKGWLQQSDDAVLTIHPIVRDICQEELHPDSAQCDEFLQQLAQRYVKNHYSAATYQQAAECMANAADNLKDLSADYAFTAGRLYRELGNYPLQFNYFHKAMVIRKQNLPPEHPDLGTAYNELGNTYNKLGDSDTALIYLTQALEIREKLLSPDHPDLAKTYSDIGITYGKLGDRNTELQFLKKSLAIREAILPPDHTDLAKAYSNLGIAYGKRGDRNTELYYLKLALDIREKTLSPDHLDLARTYSSFGVTHGKLGHLDTELHYLKLALRIRKKVLPPDHPDLARTYSSIGVTYGKLGDRNTELHYLNLALDIRKKVLPPDHPDLAKAYHNIGLTYKKMGDFEMARLFLDKAHIIRKKVLSPSSSQPGSGSF